MSADNYIYINRKSKPIEVWYCVASQISDDIKDQKVSLIGKTTTLKEAIDLAEKFEDDLNADCGYIEYGISFYLWWK